MGGATESRNGKILLSIIENTPYTDPPQSRIEELLIELKEIIEAGGGGGTTSYDGLTGKPKINGYTLSGDVSLSDIGAASEDDLSEKQDTIPDLSTIRSGAAAGSTAVQPADMSTALATKQDKLTFDSTPTESSTNPVTSGGVWTDQQRQETEIGAVANAGAKNLLDYTFSINGDTSARTSNGVTFTINADRSISTSGTASANITSAWIQMDYVVPSDPVILSGCPAGGANNTYRIDILDGSPTSSIVAADYGDGVIIQSSMFTNGIGLIRIRIQNGQNVDGLVFKPMIRPASITDDTFVPYAPTNRELYEMILALQSGGASTQSTAALMRANSTIDPGVMPEKGEKQNE